MDKVIPLVATRDIGTAAARLLAEGGSGKRVIELAGPREYTPRDVAAAVERIVGKPIDVQQAPEEAMAPALIRDPRVTLASAHSPGATICRRYAARCVDEPT